AVQHPALATGAAGPAVAAVAAHATRGARGAPGTDRARPAGTALTAVAEQPGSAAVAARLPGSSGSSVAAVAPQKPSGPAVLPGPRHPVGAVAQQRATQQRLPGRKHAQALQWRGIGRLGGRVRNPRAVQRLHEPLVEGRRLSTERLIGLG